MSNATELNDALASNYLLCDLQIRSWSGKRTDKEASAELLTSKNATKDGGHFIKNLLASAGEELKNVHQHGASLRHFVYSRTLPWSASAEGIKRGERLIASTLAMNFLQEFRGHKKEYDASVLQLVGVWDARVGQAMQSLGLLANSLDYPTSTKLPEMFSVRVDMRPIPAVGDFERLNIPATLAKALGERHAAVAQVQVSNAMNEMRDRMLAELERINSQMSKHANGEKTRLYDSLITNMQGLVQMARNMNLTNNPKLIELADRIEQKLLTRPVDAYREDRQAAKVVADSARELSIDAAMKEIWE